jgi:hypothetical protein
MKTYFFRKCKTCDSILKFKEKDEKTVFDCYCKICRKNKKMTETKDI